MPSHHHVSRESKTIEAKVRHQLHHTRYLVWPGSRALDPQRGTQVRALRHDIRFDRQTKRDSVHPSPAARVEARIQRHVCASLLCVSNKTHLPLRLQFFRHRHITDFPVARRNQNTWLSFDTASAVSHPASSVDSRTR